MKGLLPLMVAGAALGLAENPPVKSDEEALTDIHDALEWLEMNDADGDSARAKLQNIAILRAQIDRYAEFLIPSLSDGDVEFCVREVAE